MPTILLAEAGFVQSPFRSRVLLPIEIRALLHQPGNVSPQRLIHAEGQAMQQAVKPSPETRRGAPNPGGGAVPSTADTRRAAVSAAFLADSMLVHAPKRRRTALRLCLFLGWMGAHQYYVGRRGAGRLYLFTCFGNARIFSIVAL